MSLKTVRTIEFKRRYEYGNPRPQLLAELINAVELNHWKFIKGAYNYWGNFAFCYVGKVRYWSICNTLYQMFDYTKIGDLCDIQKPIIC